MSNHTYKIEDQRTVLVDAASSAAMGFEPTSSLLNAGWNVQYSIVSNDGPAEVLGRYSVHLWHATIREGDDLPIGSTGYGDSPLEAMAKACEEVLGDIP